MPVSRHHKCFFYKNIKALGVFGQELASWSPNPPSSPTVAPTASPACVASRQAPSSAADRPASPRPIRPPRTPTPPHRAIVANSKPSWQTHGRIATDSGCNVTDEAAQLADRVTELVGEHWHKRHEPLLLSQLGGADQGEVGRRAKELSGNLAAFIKHHAADRVRLASGSAHPLVVAAVPVNVDQNVEVDDLLVRARERAENSGPRFHRAFWAAFRVPLGEGNTRFVSTRMPIQFEDTPSTMENHPTGYVEVERQYIAGAECDVQGVQRLIARWLDANELEQGTFLATNSAVSNLPKHDLLGHLLIALDAEDLKRMTIPLDVVRKLRQQAV